MRPSARTSIVTIALLGAIPTGVVAADSWHLMSRHGDCFPIRSLERKFADLGNVSDPDAFVAFVKAKGLDVSSRTISLQGRKAVEVLVPGKDLSLVFVTPESCQGKEGR